MAEVIGKMIEALFSVICVVGFVLMIGRFYKTMAGGLLGIFFLVALGTHATGVMTSSYLLVMDGVLICGGLYAGAREAGITSIWSYFIAAVGVCLATTTIFGISLEGIA